MKVISLWQPWAQLIVLGEKKIETRSWATNIRGTIAIHATKHIPQTGLIRPCECVQRETEALIKHGYSSLCPQDSLPMGAIVGTVDIIDCCKIRCVRPVKRDGQILKTAFLEAENRLIEVSGDELQFGNYTPDRYGWILSNPVAFENPIPAKGMQGFWSWLGLPEKED